jgi:hypothetical protein
MQRYMVLSRRVRSQTLRARPLFRGLTLAAAILALAAACDGLAPSGNVSGIIRNPSGLSALSVGQGQLSPVFASSTVDYSVTVPNAVTQMTITATATDPSHVVRVNQIEVPSGQATPPIPLNIGQTIITVAVMRADGQSAKSYTLVVSRGL